MSNFTKKQKGINKSKEATANLENENKKNKLAGDCKIFIGVALFAAAIFALTNLFLHGLTSDILQFSYSIAMAILSIYKYFEEKTTVDKFFAISVFVLSMVVMWPLTITIYLEVMKLIG